MALWYIGYHYCITSFIQAWTLDLCRFKSCLWHVRDLRWWEYLTMVLAESKAKCLLLVNHFAKKIHPHRIDRNKKFLKKQKKTNLWQKKPFLPFRGYLNEKMVWNGLNCMENLIQFFMVKPLMYFLNLWRKLVKH